MSTKCKTQNNQILQIYCFFCLLRVFYFIISSPEHFPVAELASALWAAGTCSASAALLTLLLSGRRNLVWGKKGKKLLFFVLREVVETENAASFEYSDA